MTGFLFDPVYKILKIENNVNSSTLGRKTKPYKDTAQSHGRVSSGEVCDITSCGENGEGFNITNMGINKNFSHIVLSLKEGE